MSTSNVRFAATLARLGSPSTEYNSNSKKVLDELPRGAYTTARTFEKYSVFELETHVTRMAQSCRLLASEDASLPAELSDAALLSPLVQQTMVSAISGFERLFRPGTGQDPEEYKLTLVATWDAVAGKDCSQRAAQPGHQKFDVYCHCQPLDYKKKEVVRCEIRGSPRENALAKDSNWHLTRKPLEQLMAAGCEEVLMADEDSCIPEGSQTNFYAIDAETGELVTAGEGVLEGTVRRVALDVCVADGIGVRLESPSVLAARQGKWAGCAISSTSRLFLPVHRVTLPAEGKTVEESGGEQECLVFGAGSDGPYKDRCTEIAARVREQVSSHSSPLPGLPEKP